MSVHMSEHASVQSVHIHVFTRVCTHVCTHFFEDGQLLAQRLAQRCGQLACKNVQACDHFDIAPTPTPMDQNGLCPPRRYTTPEMNPSVGSSARLCGLRRQVAKGCCTAALRMGSRGRTGIEPENPDRLAMHFDHRIHTRKSLRVGRRDGTAATREAEDASEVGK